MFGEGGKHTTKESLTPEAVAASGPPVRHRLEISLATLEMYRILNLSEEHRGQDAAVSATGITPVTAAPPSRVHVPSLVDHVTDFNNLQPTVR